MRAAEIIRDLLDIIEKIDSETTPEVVQPDSMANMTAGLGVEPNRFRQILDLLTQKPEQMYDNSPAEVVASIDSVTVHAGGGLNGPKNPADIRADSQSMYPGYQAKMGE